MRKLFLLFVAFVATTTLWAFEVGNLKYTIITDSTVEVSRYTAGHLGYKDCNIPAAVTYKGITYNVTSIGRNAFSGARLLSSITIPNSITSIGSGAFGGCLDLTYISIPNTVTNIGISAFGSCTSLTSATIGNSVTSIGDQAFQYCSSLTSITIPNSVTSIGAKAFDGCKVLKSVVWNAENCIDFSFSSYPFYNPQITSFTFGDNVKHVPAYLCCFMRLTSIIIPESVTSIGDGAFYGCSSLTSVTIPNSVTSIGNEAFYNCSSLTSITIPNSVTSIGDWAFYNCESLTKTNYTGDIAGWCNIEFVDSYANPMCYSHNFYINDQEIKDLVIPNTVGSIHNYAFYNCSSLTSITIPNSVTSIGDVAFSSCSSLTSVTIPNSVTSIGVGAFEDCRSLTSVTIPNSVKSIGEGAFYNCSSLTSVTIPNSVTSIGEWAFASCSSLTSVTIPNSVTSIGEWAFQDCHSLTSITIPNSVTSIGGRAFEDCRSLTSVTIPNSVTSIGDNAFYGCNIDSIILSASDIATFCQGNTNDLLRQQDITSPRKLLIKDVKTKEIDIPNSVESIKPYAFYNCIDLNKVSLSNNSVKTIGNSAFIGCSSLTSITIPNSVTSIGDNAFYGCNIDSIILSASDIATFCQGNTNDLLRQQDITSPRKLLIKDVETKEIDIPNSVESIKPYAFYNCIDLNKVSLSNNSVKTIGNSAFIGCSGLTSVTIGNCVTSIGDDAFRDCSNLTSITIPNSVTSIGYCAFAGCTGLNRLDLGTGITNISNNAFNGCSKLYDIYCYAAEPPTAQESSFTNYNAILHIPCESQRLYILDVLFGEFKYIECIASDEVPTDDIVITPGSTDVTITWPTEEGADTYTIVIKKDGEVVCTLTFNAEGQLLNIAFAPGRDGNHPAQYAEQAGKGYRFTVTGLEEGVDYTYDITVKDASSKTIKSYAGEFTTGLYTAVDNITTDNANTQKLLRDGQLLILKDNKVYTLMGTEL